MKNNASSPPFYKICDYRNIWGLFLVVLVILLFFFSYLQLYLNSITFEADNKLALQLYQQELLEDSSILLNADSAVLVENGQQRLLHSKKGATRYDDRSRGTEVKKVIVLSSDSQLQLSYNANVFYQHWQALYMSTVVITTMIFLVFACFIYRFKKLHHDSIKGVISNIYKLAKKESCDLSQQVVGLAYDMQSAVKLLSHEIEVKDVALFRQGRKWQDALSEARNQFIQARLSKEKLEQELVVRKIFEDKIEAMQHHLNGIINSIPSMIIALNHSLKITEWNSAAEQFTGISQEEALGKSIMRIFPKAIDIISKKELLSHLKEVYQCKRVTFIKEDGLKVYLEACLYPLTTDSIGGVVIRIDDLTTQSRLEDIMVQTEKMMSVGGLAAGMAHEINNPLGGILQSAQNIQRRIDPASSANLKKAKDIDVDLQQTYVYLEKRGIVGFIRGIRDLAERAATIVQNMLHFSRASDTKLIPSDLSELINRTITLAMSDYDLKKSYDFKRIEIYKEFDSQLSSVPCSPPELEQVILNLVRNAAQAMFLNPDKGSKESHTITVRTYKDGGDAVIEVEDTGPGIPPDIQAQVFQPFFTTKEVGVGTGLGLSVSNFIIKTKHKGEMSVQSTQGEGTVFTIKIPLVDKSS